MSSDCCFWHRTFIRRISHLLTTTYVYFYWTQIHFNCNFSITDTGCQRAITGPMLCQHPVSLPLLVRYQWPDIRFPMVASVRGAPSVHGPQYCVTFLTHGTKTTAFGLIFLNTSVFCYWTIFRVRIVHFKYTDLKSSNIVRPHESGF